MNRAFTTLSYGGSRVGVFPDGQEHPGLGVTPEGKNEEGCITLLNSVSCILAFLEIATDPQFIRKTKPWLLGRLSRFRTSRILRKLPPRTSLCSLCCTSTSDSAVCLANARTDRVPREAHLGTGWQSIKCPCFLPVQKEDVTVLYVNTHTLFESFVDLSFRLVGMGS